MIIRLIQKLVVWALGLAIIGLLVLFVLQFRVHPPKIDTLLPVVKLHLYGDPFLNEIGSWVGIKWPPAPPAWTLLPLFVTLAVFFIMLKVESVLHKLNEGIGARRWRKRREKSDDLPKQASESMSLPDKDVRDLQADKSASAPANQIADETAAAPHRTLRKGALAFDTKSSSSTDKLESTPVDDGVLHIGRYEILGELGRGAMGAVYQARDPQIARTVAIKMILMSNQSEVEKEQFKQRFYREAQTAGQMSHPGIVTIHDVNEDEHGQPYLVMEFIEGATLDTILAPEAPDKLPISRTVREKLDIAVQVADALDYAHRRNVIHRDIKPANIMVTTEGKAKIADFGIAKLAGTQMTHTGLLVGTPAFMSPEQITGGQVDNRSDIFAFGIVLYWMFSGVKPFTGQAITEVVYKVIHSTPAPLTQINGDLPPELDTIVARCMSKKPEERYQSARDLMLELARLRAQMPPSSSMNFA